MRRTQAKRQFIVLRTLRISTYGSHVLGTLASCCCGFVMLVGHRSITCVAWRLHLTQPAVSQQFRRPKAATGKLASLPDRR